ncbi:hypothetical protein EXIGLDRAFT_845089 [Exidia glandulosa HHB12029]|uniref:Transmembrane protein n=1 Tax=Exidia glandulosa HHB12029 TaxID=1314781 RepID=A0A165ZAR2_EXIGL|nr:hypothetical protein EXIGLDRAFT_845089 [Exidia glandulosa HHB12029]
MGPPALYIVGGVVVAAGAVIAFKELVYDPYIHPRIEAYLARLEGRRLARAHLAEAQFLTEQRPVSYPVRRPKDVELRDVRRRKNYVDVDEPTPPRSPLPGPSTSRQFGLQTPTPTESPAPTMSTHQGQEQAPLIDLGPFADPLIETAAAAPHTRDRSTPSLLRTPPPPPGMGIMRPSAPGPAPQEDDDDLVLSFISDRLRAQRHPEHARGSSSAEEHEDVIRLPMPSSSPSSPRALTSETFVPPVAEPRSPSMRTMSSASASSRAISPFAVEDSPFETHSESFDNYHSGTGTGTLRRSVLSPIPSSSLTAAHAHSSPPPLAMGQVSPPPYRPGPPSPRSPTMSASSWSLTSDPDAEWHASDADEVEFDFADDENERERERRNGEFDVRSVSSSGRR